MSHESPVSVGDSVFGEAVASSSSIYPCTLETITENEANETAHKITYAVLSSFKKQSFIISLNSLWVFVSLQQKYEGKQRNLVVRRKSNWSWIIKLGLIGTIITYGKITFQYHVLKFLLRFAVQCVNFIVEIFGSVRTAVWILTTCPHSVPVIFCSLKIYNFSHKFYEM